jgi:hypothetical protein
MKTRVHEALQEVKDHFTAWPFPTTNQSHLKEKNSKLLKESKVTWAGLSRAAMYRHKAAQETLNQILKTHGETACFLAAHALQLTTLQPSDTVLEGFSEWFSPSEIPSNFIDYAKTELCHPFSSGQNLSMRHRDSINDPMADRSVAERVDGFVMLDDGRDAVEEETDYAPVDGTSDIIHVVP